MAAGNTKLRMWLGLNTVLQHTRTRTPQARGRRVRHLAEEARKRAR